MRPPARMMRERLAALHVRFRGGRAGLPICRGRSAAAAILEGEDAFSDQIPESPVQGGTIGLVAERPAEVVAVEDVRHVCERRLDFALELPGRPPGWPWRRPRRSLSWSSGRLSFRAGGCLQEAWKRHCLVSGGHPDQIQGPGLLSMGGLEQLDTGAELLVEPPPAVFVFFACHSAGIASQRAEQGNLPYRYPRQATGNRHRLLLEAPPDSPGSLGRFRLQVLEMPQSHGLITEACDDLKLAAHRLDVRPKRADVHVGLAFNLGYPGLVNVEILGNLLLCKLACAPHLRQGHFGKILGHVRF